MKTKKLISGLLMATLTFSLIPGCIDAQEVNAPVEEFTSILDFCDKMSYDTSEDFYRYLESLPSKDTGDILNNPYEHSEIDVAKAAYDNLSEKGLLEDEVIQSELNNVLAYSIYPMGLTDEEYQCTVGNLAGTLEQEQNPFSCYYPLALGAHLSSCDEEHTTNEFGKVECPTILGLWDELGTRTTSDMLDSLFSQDEAYLRIKEASVTSGVSLDIFLTELETLVELSKNPTDIHDDALWLELFGNLDATLKEEESLYEVYITLATKIHNMLYVEDELELPEDLSLSRE